jgi:protocatechuate 3,4-dioxygenase beta subunit
MSSLQRAALTAFFALSVTAPAAAQMQTGSILVRVTDDQGAAVPGVAVTLTSPVLVAGSTSGVTDGAGANRFPSLQPGVYAVRLEL